MSKPGPFGRLARWVLAHKPAVGIATALVTVISVVMTAQLRVDPNLLALLPKDDPSSQALRALAAEGGANVLTLAFEAEDPTKLDPYLDDLCTRLDDLDEVRFAVHEVDPDLAFRLGLLQLETTEVEQLVVRLRGALALGPALNPIVTQRLMDMGPLTQKIASAGTVGPLGAEEEGKGRVLVRPTGSSSDPIFAAKLIGDVERVIAESDPATHGVALTWMGGAYRHNVEDREGIARDLTYTSIASGLLVLASIVIAFRSLKAAVVLYGPLLISNALNLAVVWVLYGSINTYTSFGTAILLGLGVDYGSHLLARYRELRGEGVPMEDAIARAWDRVGPPCTTACLTAVAGFLALASARFQGFSQLGVVLAIGLVATLIAAVVITPALIPWLDPNPPKPLVAPDRKRSSWFKGTYRMAPLALMALVVATGVAATRLPRLEWEFDLSALRRDGLAFDELSVEEQALARESFSPTVLTYDSREKLAEAHHHAEDLLAKGQLPHVARVVSIESVLPSDQAARVAALQELATLTSSPDLRYLPPPLVKNLLRLRGYDVHALAPADLPPDVLELLGAGQQGHYRLLLFAQGNMWDLREAAKLKDEVQAAFPDEQAAGELVAIGSLYRIVLQDMPMVAGLALLLVAILTAIDTKRFTPFAGAFGTLLAGMIWAGVFCQAVGVKLSLLNVVGIPILFGISIDVCVHLLHRIQEEGPGGVFYSLRTTGVAAVLSTGNTITSFLSLLLAGNRGVRSLGLLVSVGLTTVFIVSCVLLPLAWAAGWRITGRAPGDTRRRYVKPAHRP